MPIFDDEQEQALNDWARTDPVLHKEFPYTQASGVATGGLGFLLNQLGTGTIDTVRESDGTPSISPVETVSFNSTDFYVTSTSDPTEAMVNLRGTTGGGGISSVTFTDGQKIFNSSELNFNRDHFYLETASDGNPVLNAIFPASDNNITFTDGQKTFNSSELNFNRNHFYLEAATDGNPILNAIFPGENNTIRVSTANGAITITREQLYEAVKTLRFNEDDFYLSANSALDDVTVNSLLVRSAGRPGGQLVLGGNTASSANLILAGNADYNNVARYQTAGTGKVRIAQQFTFLDSLPSGSQVSTLIHVPTSFVFDGSGQSVNILTGFWFEPTIQYNTAQTLSVSPAFNSSPQWTESNAITSNHTSGGFQTVGFSGAPVIIVNHNGTSTATNLVNTGFDTAPAVRRATGKTGNTRVDLLAGYSTNTPFALRVFSPQISGAHTITKYAHFIAHSNVGSGLLVSGSPTITEEVGVDLQNLTRGTTNISLRSTSTTATMRHEAGASFGTVSDPGVVNIDTNNTPVILIDQNGFGSGINSVTNNDAAATRPIIFNAGRSRGTLGAETAVVSGDSLAAFVACGHDGTNYLRAASIEFITDTTPSASDVRAAISLRVRDTAGSNVNPGEVARCRSDRTFVLDGGGRYSLASPTSATLSADENNYDPEGVGSGGFPTGAWRLTADSADRTITGILAPQAPSTGDFHYLEVLNVGASNRILLSNDDIASTAANRILFNPPGQDFYLRLDPNEAATLLYDNNSDRWRVVSFTGDVI